MSAAATDYLDDALRGTDRALLERHLAHCLPCRERFDELRRTISLVGRLRDAQLPDAITESPQLVRRQVRATF